MGRVPASDLENPSSVSLGPTEDTFPMFFIPTESITKSKSIVLAPMVWAPNHSVPLLLALFAPQSASRLAFPL